MNQIHNPIKAYTRATHTVAKTRQVVMLYDGAIRFLKQAGEAIQAGSIEERFNKLTRVSDIITGLQGSLDYESGGSTAQVLSDFYSALDMRITGLHRKPDLAVCNSIVAELKEMRDVWDGIDRGKEAPSAPAVETEAAPELSPIGSVKFSA